MRFLIRLIVFSALLTLTVVSSLLFSRCGRSVDDKLESRSEFLERYEYQQRQINKIVLDIRPINDKLHLLMRDPAAEISIDSAKSLLRESFRVLMKCERLMYDIQEFDKQDSLMFEMYGR